MAAETTKIIIAQVPPYDGEYEIDFDQAFSGREWRWIKQLSEGELRPASLTADDISDPDFVIALAVIAMRRSGKITDQQVLEAANVLADAPMTDAHILMQFPDVEEEPLPLASTSGPDRSSPSGPLENETLEKPSVSNDGTSSRKDSALSAVTPARTGLTRLGTSSG
jgi:hypothetical protein